MTAPVVGGPGGYREDVQGLRGVAVLAVVLFHAHLLPAGFAGVDIFFVISGYVVSRGLMSALWESNLTPAAVVGSFMARRLARLMPAFATAVGLTVLLGLLLASVSSVMPMIRTATGG